MRAFLTLTLLFGLAGFATADDTIVRYDAVEAWRTVDDESVPYLFGVINQVRADSEGRVYLLDTQLQELHRFSADGEYEALVCRSGEGPGELSNTYWFTIDPQDRVVLQRGFPPGLVLVDADGTFLESVTFEGADGTPPFTFLGGGIAVTEVGFVVEGMVLDLTDPTVGQQRLLATFGPDGALIAEIARFTQPRVDFQASHETIDERARFFPFARRAVSPEGRIFVARERESYRVSMMDMEGNTLDSIERGAVARPRTAEELEEAKKAFSFSRTDGRPLPEFEFELESTVPPIAGVDFRDGALWVRVDAPDLPEECFGRFDLWSPDGEFIETREVYVPDVGDGDLSRALGASRLVVLENYRSASRAASAGQSIKVGNEEMEADEDVDAAMNVVVYDLVRR